MKMIRNYILSFLFISSFVAGLFLLNSNAFPHNKQDYPTIPHKAQVISAEMSADVDVDLFDRNDDFDRHSFVLIPSNEVVPFKDVIILFYVLTALYLSKVFIPRRKIFFDSLWQKMSTSL